MDSDLPKIHGVFTLPEQMRQKQNDIVREMDRVTESYAADSQDWQQQAEQTRLMLKTFCSHYRPDKNDDCQLLCDSGSYGRIPYCGRTCVACPVGQVKVVDGVFSFYGEEPPETPADKLTRIIFSEPNKIATR